MAMPPAKRQRTQEDEDVSDWNTGNEDADAYMKKKK
jgi:hypothetical protein